MPCSDSSSSIELKIAPNDQFISFDFAKITCGREITAKTGYSTYCVGKPLTEILQVPYAQAAIDLQLQEEEEQFILYMEWDALRSTIAQYLGIDDENIDKDRCVISSIEHNDQETNIALVILPPQELPKIIPCGMVDKLEEKKEDKG